MAYNILYIEDNDPSSITADIKHCGLNVINHEPEDFEETLKEAMSGVIDLLLLDFRLTDKKAVFDAPTLAQTIRTKNTSNHRHLPIVLISSEDIISDYYKDYSSQDLFDFAISKNQLAMNLDKYTRRMVSLIEGYKALGDSIKKGEELEVLLKIPQLIEPKFSPSAKDALTSEKITSCSFMASTFIIHHLVKPSGVLIGGDILAARLGVDKQSPDWEELIKHLDEYKYNGIYSDAYTRWWAIGLEFWWKSNFSESPSLKRLNAAKRVELLAKKFNLNKLEPAKKIDHSKSDYFWTVCQVKRAPLDPMDGFEKDKANMSWEDPIYYSLLAASELSSPKKMKLIDRKRYLKELEG